LAAAWRNQFQLRLKFGRSFCQLTRLPVIDFREYKRKPVDIGQKLQDALHSTGFAYLKNTSLTSNIICQSLTQAEWFFDQPQPFKQELAVTDTNKYGYYHYLGNPASTQSSPIEAFLIANPTYTQLALKKDYFQIPGVDPQTVEVIKQHSNQWPQNIQFQKDISNFFDSCARASSEILTTLAMSFGLGPDYFTQYHRQADCTMELKRYPPRQVQTPKTISIAGAEHIQLPVKATKEQECHLNPHVDLSTISILVQNQSPGFQVRTKDGSWIDAPALQDCILINTGDVMHRWTNQYFPSTIHRVLEVNETPRLSVVYFCVPNWATKIAPLPLNGDPHFSPIIFGDMVPLHNSNPCKTQ